MKTSVARQMFASQEDGSEYERLRGIEREYEIETVAENTRQLVQFQAMTLRITAGQASRTLGRLAALAGSGEADRVLNPRAGGDVRAIIGNVDALTASPNSPITLPQLPPATEGDGPVEGLQTVLLEMFERTAKHHLKNQKALHAVGVTLREAYEAPFLGMRNEAEKWLVSGMKRTGRDRDEDLNDALRLMRASLDSPFGNGDYVAWFQLGWLLWQHDGSLADAADAFYKAQRLSADAADLYYIKSLRHLAYIQYLQGNYNEAYITVQKGLAHDPDHEAKFEAARYAAMVGRGEESIHLLGQCIRERPTTIISMFAESDFLRAPQGTKLLTDMADLASNMLDTARRRTAKNLQHWRMGLMVVESAEKLIGHKVDLPEEVRSQALAQVPDVSQADYLMALEIDRRSLTAGDKVLHVARNSLRQETRDMTSLLGKAQGELEKLEFAGRRRMTEALDWKEEQISEMPSLMSMTRGKSGIILSIVFIIFGAILEWMGRPIADVFIRQVGGAADGSLGVFLDKAYTFGAWMAFMFVIFVVASMCDLVIRQRLKVRIEKVFEEVVRVDEAQSAGELGALRKTVWDMTRRKQRAEEALRLIEPN